MRRAAALLLALGAAATGCNAILGIDDPKHKAPAVCGDGKLTSGEGCDDGDTRDGDGCNASCSVEHGFSCTGEPSKCRAVCGDGVLAGDEVCDDGNAKAGDGCDAICAVEKGFTCEGEPSHCSQRCGDGVIAPGEDCDDGDDKAGDGCDKACHVEHGYLCSGEPSGCVSTCGDGQRASDETCDDGNGASGDGCDDACLVEHGYQCSGEPSACSSHCGDGVVAANEECDDGNGAKGDGCDVSCVIEHGYVCNGEPSMCSSQCGDGALGPGEACDDGNGAAGDGCSAGCQVEAGFTCDTAEPTVCKPICGDGLLVKGEGCDDHALVPGDGCDATCKVEPGWICAGQPSACGGICGDGMIIGAEQCDDGNAMSGDCCSSACQIEAGCEIEPNNSFVQADARAVDAVPISFSGSGFIRGAVSPVNDVDTFVYDLAAASTVVRFETFDGTKSDCIGLDTKLTVYNGIGFPVVPADANAGIGLCSALVVPLTAGSYYVRVEQAGGAVIPLYAVEVNQLSSSGTESESNDTLGTADSLAGTNAFIAGSHQAAGDLDYFAITVPGPTKKSVRAEIIEANGGGETCESGGMASRLTLVNALNSVLADDDAGGGRGACSMIDGTGATPLHAGAHLLNPGTYYLLVRASTGASGAAAQFDYRLAVTIR